MSTNSRWRVGVWAVAIVVGVVARADAQSRGGPFTHPERSVRSRDVDQQHVRLELDFDFEKQSFRGRAIHTLSLYRPLTAVELDAAEMKVESAARLASLPPAPAASSTPASPAESGEESSAQAEAAAQTEQPLTFRVQGDKLTIELGKEVPAGEVVYLAIDYLVSKPRHGAHFVVPDAQEQERLQMVWTQSEPEYARYWYPCLDTPSDRLTSEIIVTAPERFFVLSNGVLKSRQSSASGKRLWHWSQGKSHAPYLLSVVVGEFEAYEQQWNGVPVVSYVPRGRLADAPRSFEKTPAMMEFFSRKIGLAYPWPKYAQVCVDEYGWGGMEHTSATTLNLKTLHDERAHLDINSDNLVAHELAHQWWGDLLTCKDWGEIWLNESFATYFASLWTEHDLGWEEAALQRAEEADDYLGEDRQYRRSIVNYRYNSAENVFDRHSYPKGARVLHMLRFELGDERFWASLQRYCAVNQYRTVETADLRRAIEDATGQGMNWFFDQWVHHGGHPQFEVSWRWDEPSKTVRVTVKQTQKVDELTPLFRCDAELEIAGTAGAVMHRVTLSKAEETFHFQAESEPTRVCFDPRDWILKELRFPRSKTELLDQLAHSAHASSRREAAAELAALAPDDDVRLALQKAAQGDAFWGVRREATKSLGKFPGDESRRALIDIARTDARSHVRRAAAQTLGSFAHAETTEALREMIYKDQSYYAIADALSSLAKVDRPRAAGDALAALEQDSHQETIVRAACDVLVELRHEPAVARLQSLLEEPLSPDRRIVLIGALARLKSDQPEYAEMLRRDLDNSRPGVRMAAIQSLGRLGDPSAIEPLLARRAHEESRGVVRAIDEAVDKLRAARGEIDKLRQELDETKKQNSRLEERLRKLEEAVAP